MKLLEVKLLESLLHSVLECSSAFVCAMNDMLVLCEVLHYDFPPTGLHCVDRRPEKPMRFSTKSCESYAFLTVGYFTVVIATSKLHIV